MNSREKLSVLRRLSTLGLLSALIALRISRKTFPILAGLTVSPFSQLLLLIRNIKIRTLMKKLFFKNFSHFLIIYLDMNLFKIYSKNSIFLTSQMIRQKLSNLNKNLIIF